MCVIIYKNKNVNIELETLKLACETNKDGVGVAYKLNNKWYIEKILKPTQKTLNYLIEKTKKREAVIHFRIATSGGVNKLNLHPFLFDGNKCLLFHNGVLSTLNNASKKYNDTQLFTFLLEHKKVNKHELLKNISGYNKFILIDEDNKLYFYGNFLEYKGLKCSNLNFLPNENNKELTCKKWDVGEWYTSRYNLFKNDNDYLLE